jgi:uncharacterized protein
MDQIPYSVPLDYNIYTSNGKWAVLFTHGERTDITDELFKSMGKELVKKGITFINFRLPFKMLGKKHPDALNELDEAFITVFNHITTDPRLEGKRIAIAGHGVGGATALRISGLVSVLGEIPPIIVLSYPMYPPNRPEAMNVSELGAILSNVLFITGDKGNRGTHDRLISQLAMAASFAETKLIKGGNHDLEVPDRKPYLVGRWIANDISVFLSTIR